MNHSKDMMKSMARKTAPSFGFVCSGAPMDESGAHINASGCEGGCGGQCLSGCKDECITVSK